MENPIDEILADSAPLVGKADHPRVQNLLDELCEDILAADNTALSIQPTMPERHRLEARYALALAAAVLMVCAASTVLILGNQDSEQLADRETVTATTGEDASVAHSTSENAAPGFLATQTSTTDPSSTQEPATDPLRLEVRDENGEIVSQVFADDSAVDLTNAPTGPLAFVLEGEPEGSQSALMVLEGPVKLTALEEVPPFSLFKNSGTEYYTKRLQPGEYQLSVEIFSDSGASGDLLTRRTFSFNL